MAQPNDRPATHPNRWTKTLSAWSIRIGCHALGVMVIAALVLAPYVDKLTLQTIWSSAQHAGFVQLSWFDAVLHLGLAGCLWTLLVLLFEVVSARRKPVAKLMNLEQGSVMTETLVILPIFFLLTFGIAQLAVNNIAGLLANTAVFQATRTAWLWSAEADASRRGASPEMMQNLARAQAAAVITPVAPGEFMQSTSTDNEQFEQMRGLLLGSQLPSFSTDTGQTAMSATTAMLMGDNMTNLSGINSSFSRAFDTSSFRARTVRKFTFAYHTTELTITEPGNEIQVELSYHHHQAFPMVGALFGEHRTYGNRAGFYSTIERTFSMPKQIPPNTTTP